MIEAIVGTIIVLFCMAAFGKTNEEVDAEDRKRPYY